MNRAVVVVLLIVSGVTAAAAQNKSSLRPIVTIDLPGPAGKRFDYLVIEPSTHRLFVAHLGAGLLHVVDLRSNRVLKTIPDLPGVEGIAVLSRERKLYASAWWEDQLAVINLDSLEVVKKIETGPKPDAIAIAAPFHKAYVSNERGRSETVIDTTRDVTLATIEFNSDTGVPQYDPVSRKIFLNLQDDSQVAEIDPKTDKVIGNYPVEGCRHNHGMALDPPHRRAFIVCEGNAVLAVFDLATHRVMQQLPLAAAPDVVDFDPGLQRIYVACNSGAISIFQQSGSSIKKLQDFPVPKQVHSLVVDRTTHRVYTAESQEEGKPVGRLAIYAPER